MVSELEQNLQLLDFDIHTSSSALLFTNQNYRLEHIPFGELLVLDEPIDLVA